MACRCLLALLGVLMLSANAFGGLRAPKGRRWRPTVVLHGIACDNTTIEPYARA